MFFPDAQQKGSRFEVRGVQEVEVGGRQLTRNPRAAFASVRRVFAVCPQASTAEKSSRNAELSSLLDSRWVVASQKCKQSQALGGVVVASRTVVAFGLAWRLRV